MCGGVQAARCHRVLFPAKAFHRSGTKQRRTLTASFFFKVKSDEEPEAYSLVTDEESDDALGPVDKEDQSNVGTTEDAPAPGAAGGSGTMPVRNLNELFTDDKPEVEPEVKPEVKIEVEKEVTEEEKLVPSTPTPNVPEVLTGPYMRPSNRAQPHRNQLKQCSQWDRNVHACHEDVTITPMTLYPQVTTMESPPTQSLLR